MNKLLTDVCEIQYGYAFDSNLFSTDNGLPIVRIRDVVRGYSETRTTESCSENYYVYDGDILVGMDGEFNTAKWNGGKAVLNQRVCKLIPKDTEIDSDYLFYYMPKALKAIEDKTPFVTVKHLSAKELNKVVIPIPEREKQIYIAKSLRLINSLLVNCQIKTEKLDELIKSRFVEMFGNFVYEKDKWSKCLVGDIAGTVDPQPSHRTPPVEKNGIPYIGIAECDYQTRTINFDAARKVGKNVLQEHISRYDLHRGDFIIGKIGTIGKPFFIPEERKYALSANTVLIQPNMLKVAPNYLFSVFQSEYMDRIIDAEKKSTSQPAFGIQKVRAIEIPLPPLDLQNQFADFVTQVEKQKATVQQSIDKLETLKESLIQKYFG